jgi:amino acid permease
MSEQGRQLDYTVIGLWACICVVSLALWALILAVAKSIGAVVVAAVIAPIILWLACTGSDTDGA